MVRAVVSRPAGRAVSTERRAAGARDNLSAAPATWLSILGLLRAPPAPLQLPRHPRVSQPLDLLPPRIGSLGPALPLGPIPSGWGSRVALARGTPRGGGGRIWKGRATAGGREGRGLLRLALGLARRVHPAWPGRRVASRHRGLRPGEAGGYAPLSLPGTPRPLVRLGLPAPRAKAGARLPAAPSVPSPGRGGVGWVLDPGPWCPDLLSLSPPPPLS